MNDMRAVIVPKSNQLNADDLIGGPMTITITQVTITPGDQPVAISFDGDRGKPFKCCKSMARVMVACWGPDANVYPGRSMTLYRDPRVKWGGMEVGGIRISHMTDLPGNKPHTMALTETKGNKKLFTVQPLNMERPVVASERTQANQEPSQTPLQKATEWLQPTLDSLATVNDQDAFNEAMMRPKLRPGLQAIERDYPTLYAKYEDARAAAMERIVPRHVPEYYEDQQESGE